MNKTINDEKQTYTLIIGAISLIFLMLIYGVDKFSNYLFDKIIWFLISSFFVIPIIRTLINRKYNRDDTVPFILGIVGIWFYTLIFNLTFIEWSVYILETIIMISIISVVFNLFKEGLKT